VQATQAKLCDSTADLLRGQWQTVELLIPSAAGALRVQLADHPAVIELREISIHSEDGDVVWAARTLPELQEVPVAGSLIVLPRHDSCLFFNFGSDPVWVLPLPDETAFPVTVKALLLVHKDFEVVAEAIAAVYAEMDLMTAQVRTASAERNQTVRDLLWKLEEQAASIQLGNQQRDALELEAQTLRSEQARWERRSAELQAQRDALEFEAQTLRQTLLAWEQSRSWRLTRPLRSAAGLAQKLRKNFD
jgi:hypothetical protein